MAPIAGRDQKSWMAPIAPDLEMWVELIEEAGGERSEVDEDDW